MNGYYIAGFIIALACIGFGVYYLMRADYKKFKTMKYSDVLWRWRWKKESIYALAPYCPTCNEELWYDDENSKATTNLNEKITFLVCEKCGGEQKGRIKGGDRDFAISLVKREILRKVRSGEYKEKTDE